MVESLKGSQEVEILEDNIDRLQLDKRNLTSEVKELRDRAVNTGLVESNCMRCHKKVYISESQPSLCGICMSCWGKKNNA